MACADSRGLPLKRIEFLVLGRIGGTRVDHNGLANRLLLLLRWRHKADALQGQQRQLQAGSAEGPTRVLGLPS